MVQHTLERITLQLHAAGVDEAAGLSIITVTILTKMITYPFTKKQVESTMASANLQPVIKAIKARYGEDKEKVQAETSRVFKDAGVNPLAGCLPSIIQLPVFWGLYRALTNAAADNDFNEPFFFIPNLSGAPATHV
jgi:YidC/Oxa1 family membrane protein insertase